jgi:hypothetical protein
VSRVGIAALGSQVAAPLLLVCGSLGIAGHKLACPNAQSQCRKVLWSWLVTGDERWKKRLAPIASRVRVCYLGDFV